MKTFAEVFGKPPAVSAQAPGRVNLLGEHTDYNDGYVLPTAIPQTTCVSIRENGGKQFSVYAAELEQAAEFTMESAPPEYFASYVYGCVRELHDHSFAAPPLDIHISSSIPIGVGLSSSAALEVATLRALRQLFKLRLDDVTIAQLAQRAEIRYAGVNCGIMDQMASSLADTGSMLFLDTRSLQRRVLPVPARAEILVIDSGVARSLAGSKYNERRAECEQAAQLLGVRALRDVTDTAAIEKLPQPLRRRARHVVSENDRVLRAVESTDAESFGELMNASHNSLRDDYEVSIRELDRLVELLQGQSGVHGARLTGAGFGGACVALCVEGETRAIGERVLGAYNNAGQHGRILVPSSGDSRA
ncbi:MAG TPA: galactokinase [Candidatus Binatia bacterium]